MEFTFKQVIGLTIIFVLVFMFMLSVAKVHPLSLRGVLLVFAATIGFSLIVWE